MKIGGMRKFGDFGIGFLLRKGVKIPFFDMKRSKALSVGEIIDRAIASTGDSVTFEKQQACFLWQEVVGPGINRYTTRRWIEGEVMHVCIASASIKSELTYCRDSLIEAINNAIGRQIITSIVIH